jgi:twitching motility protein PilT
MQNTKFGFILLENPFIRSEDVERCLKIQELGGNKQPIGQILLEQGVIGKHMLQQILAVQEHRRARSSREQPSEMVSDAGPQQRLDDLIERAAANGATDLLVGVGRRPMARFNGYVEAISGQLIDAEWMEQALAEIGGNAELGSQLGRQVTQLPYTCGSQKRRCRVQVFSEGSGPSLSVRIWPAPVPSLDALGHDPLVASMTDFERGLLLVSGPAVSGKSTTIASMLERLGAQRPRHLLSLCYRPEAMPQVGESVHTRRQIGRDCESLAAGLQDAFREDADVIVIDELDREMPLQLLLQAATTQALVIVVSRASSSVAAIERMLDSVRGGEQAATRSAFVAALRGLVYQELLPAAGRRGSLLASEVVTPSEEIQQAIVEDALDRIPILVSLAHGVSCRDFDEVLLDLAESGQIENDEAFVRSRDKQRLMNAAMGS